MESVKSLFWDSVNSTKCFKIQYSYIDFAEGESVLVSGFNVEHRRGVFP